MNPHELDFFKIQKPQLLLRRMEHGYLCNGYDTQVPPRIVKYGNLDAQDQGVLVKQFGLSKGSMVIDVGGFIGDTAWAFSEAGCHVVTFEPFLENYLALLWNMRGRDVISYLIALGNGERVKLDYAYQDSDPGMLRVVDDPNGVPTMRLDELFPWSHISLLKIDCEGREIQVLQGAAKTIARYRPPMFIESFPDGLKMQGNSVVALHEQIRSMGYVIEEDDTNYVNTRDLICRPIV